MCPPLWMGCPQGHGRTHKTNNILTTMKKLYTQPLVEQEELFVEAGIALSGDVYDEIILLDEQAGSLDSNIW